MTNFSSHYREYLMYLLNNCVKLNLNYTKMLFLERDIQLALLQLIILCSAAIA